jgi:hypothetical protein
MRINVELYKEMAVLTAAPCSSSATRRIPKTRNIALKRARQLAMKSQGAAIQLYDTWANLPESRFNTIIMNSMPRNIAEYIQASSRVAREQKGLVLTLHNPFRSRDVSHYEKFREFHEKLYFYVEPISITPFSKKSVEKYLALYLAAIVRHSYDKLADRNSASKINESNLSDQIKQMVADYFNQRYDRMQKPEISQLEKGLLTPELRDNIIRFVDEAIGQWEAKANEVDGLVYNSTQYQNAAALFSIPAGYDNSNGDNLWTVPLSLRIVEPEAVLHIRVGNDGN